MGGKHTRRRKVSLFVDFRGSTLDRAAGAPGRVDRVTADRAAGYPVRSRVSASCDGSYDPCKDAPHEHTRWPGAPDTRRIRNVSSCDVKGSAISTSELSRDFPGVRAVDALTLEVPRGSIFGFLGRNGAGKTTTIRLLLGLIEATRGTARVLGFDPETESRKIRARSGVLLESPGLLERLTAEENLDIYGRIGRLTKAERAARSEELLKRIGLWERRREPVKEWSRGMRQRLAIARALIHEPELIFLDEPTAGLDPVSAVDVRNDLLRLADISGVTVFLTTHNLAEAERLCDQVAIVRSGRLLSVGAPDEVGRDQRRPRIRLRGRGFSERTLAALEAHPDVGYVQPQDDGAIVTVGDREGISRIVAFLVRNDVALEEVSAVGKTLEDGVLSLFRVTEERSGDSGASDGPPRAAMGGGL